jgi:hypothetical protein
MTQPPPTDPSDELDARYRRLSGADSTRPSEAVQRSILAHAQELVAQRRRAEMPAARPRRWRGAVFGLLAAAALAGIMVAPRYLGYLTRPAQTAALQEAPPRVTTTIAPSALAPAIPQSTPPSVTSAARAPAPPAGLSSPAANPRRRAQAVQDVAAVPQISAPAVSSSAGTSALRPAATAQSATRSEAPLAADRASALRRAAQAGDLAALQRLLTQQPAIDARDPQGRTALMLATMNRQPEAVQALLAAGADPNAADAHGVTPLQAAMAMDSAAIVAALQQYGAH